MGSSSSLRGSVAGTTGHTDPIPSLLPPTGNKVWTGDLFSQRIKDNFGVQNLPIDIPENAPTPVWKEGVAYIKAGGTIFPIRTSRFSIDGETWEIYSPADSIKPGHPIKFGATGWKPNNNIGLQGGGSERRLAPSQYIALYKDLPAKLDGIIVQIVGKTLEERKALQHKMVTINQRMTDLQNDIKLNPANKKNHQLRLKNLGKETDQCRADDLAIEGKLDDIVASSENIVKELNRYLADRGLADKYLENINGIIEDHLGVLELSQKIDDRHAEYFRLAELIDIARDNFSIEYSKFAVDESKLLNILGRD